MKIREHSLLWKYEHTKLKAHKPTNIAEICTTCRGNCKAEKGLVHCPGKAKYKG